MKTKSNLVKCLLCLLFFLMALSQATTGKTIYVDDNAIGADDSLFQTDVNSPEEPVYFADANLKAAVEDALGVTNPTPVDMLELTDLHADRRDITDLTGLEYAKNLKLIFFYNNQINDISPLAGLTKLNWLNLDDNQVTDISPLSGLSSLRYLYLAWNHLSDISPLSELTGLRELYLDHTQISDISPLSVLINLDILDLWDNQISDISPLSGLTKLRALSLEKNQINDISSLANLTNLTGSRLCDNQISNLSPLSGLTRLQYLSLWGNVISDISPLSGLTNLRTLSLSENQISDISPLLGLINLEYLYLTENQISDISPLIDLVNIQELYLHYNQISDISALNQLTNLQYLNLDYNQISNLSPLSNLVNLQTLYLENNRLVDISPLSDLTSLQILHLGNRISYFPYRAGLSNSQEPQPDKNQIKDISPLSGLIGLQELQLGDNQISDVSPLSGLTNLRMLDLRLNLINNILPLSGLTSLQELRLSDNLISNISPLVGLTTLQRLWLQTNPLNIEAYDIYIPLLENYGMSVSYDPLVWRTLSIGSTPGGSVIEPGEGDFNYTDRTIVNIRAVADPGYYFVEWTGTAADTGDVGDPDSADTKVTLNADYTLQANFEQMYIIYVDDDATGVNDGSSWENAYIYLQDALTDAENAEKPVQIRVAQGKYTPNKGTNISIFTFQLINDVTLTGGYAGVYEPDPDERNVELYETILSGDLADDDIDVKNPSDLPDEPTRLDNCGHVVSGDSTDRSAVLDGFVITGGRARPHPAVIDYPTGVGGGMKNDSGSPTINNCTFIGNAALGGGGGMINMYDSSPIITNCKFIKNYGNSGGGVYNISSSPIFSKCLFEGNYATSSGGGMVSRNEYWRVLEPICNPKIINCIFSGNYAGRNGGGIYFAEDCNSILINCSFNDNFGKNGSALSNDSYRRINNIKVTNCILFDVSNEIYNIDGSQITINYTNLHGGLSSIDDPCNVVIWGEGNIDEDPLFADSDNGDYHLKSQAGRYNPNSGSWVVDDITSPCIDAGDPNTPFGDEPFPNSGIINMGAYGGTVEASLSPYQPLPLISQASNPIPPDGAIIVVQNITLFWTAGSDAVLHNVYFGTDFNNVRQANIDNTLDVLVSQNHTNNSFGLENLDNGQTHYWRIDEIDSQGSITIGDIWEFTTSWPKGRACFIGDTPVLVDGKLVPISEVTAGQDIGNNIEKVETVQEHEGTFTCYDVLLESGNFITVAENHYFISEAGRWLSLHDLKKGKSLKTSKGSVGIISIKKRPKPYTRKVYNLKIKDSDQYLVGKDAVIVRDY